MNNNNNNNNNNQVTHNKKRLINREQKTVDNEAFLYIDNTFHDIQELSSASSVLLTNFNKGLIMDINNNTVCPGEKIPIMDYELFEKDKNQIQYYTPLLKGKKVRFYKIHNNLSLDSLLNQNKDHQNKDEIIQNSTTVVMISQENHIYANMDELMISESEILSQVNYSLLENNTCYYATIVQDEENENHKKIILTYVTNIHTPTLEIPFLKFKDNGAFKHHLELHKCVSISPKEETLNSLDLDDDELTSIWGGAGHSYGLEHSDSASIDNKTSYSSTNSGAIHIFKTQLNKQKHGLVFYRNDGQPFEFWTPTYSLFKSYQKPYNLLTSEYYIMLLNQYPNSSSGDFNTFFDDLHYDIPLYLKHYPEHQDLFTLFKKKLSIYASLMAHEEWKNTHQEIYSSNISKLKIKAIKQLLNCDNDNDNDNNCNRNSPSNIIDILNKKTNKYIKYSSV